MVRPEVLDYYRRGGERDRLTTGAGKLEFLRTWDVLTRELPPAPTTLLDVGGATGGYAAPLAERGYRVQVVDPVPEHVAEAAARPGVSAVVGDARALPVNDGVADAVLLLGPLYHLTDRSERVRAWQEAARATRDGGVVVAATISRYASLFDGFARGYMRDPRFPLMVEQALATGEHHNPHREEGWFTTAYFHRPYEAAEEAEAAGLRVERVLPVETPLWIAAGLDELLADEALTELLLTMLRRVEDEPGLLAASSHLLTIARHGPVTAARARRRGRRPASGSPARPGAGVPRTGSATP